jgi:serine/threonine protein kinase
MMKSFASIRLSVADPSEKSTKPLVLNSGMTVAVKMAPEDKLSDPTTLAFRAVLNEMRAEMLKVNHPNVVRVLYADPGTDPNIGPYIVMEYVEGGNLQKLLDQRSSDKRPFTLEEATALMRGVALGAQAINEHLIHRDIKPDNILLAGSLDSPTPKIADFGIAKVAAGSTRPETFKGIQMWWYRAPEGWRQETNTHKMDVYSVGLVFYQILALEHPLMKHLSHPLDFDRWREVHLTVLCQDVRDMRPDVPAPLARLLLRMVDKWPNNRPEWDEVIRVLSGDAAPPRASSLDPRALGAMRAHVDQRFRDQQTRTATELKREQERERHAARSAEYEESAKRFLSEFDRIVDDYNQQDTDYQIRVKGQGTLFRQYTLMNSHVVVCQVFQYHPVDGAFGNILGGAYVGVDGGLSTNIVLFGRAEDLASTRWTPVQVTLSGIIARNRDRYYQTAGVSRATMGFLEYEYGEEPWRRDFPSYFGFSSAEAFHENYGRRGGAYNFTPTSSDIIGAFNEILVCGIRIPSRNT